MINLLKKTALEAGALVKKKFRQDFEIKFKSSYHDLVTEVDLASQKLIVERIEAGMKELGYAEDEIGFIGEEDLNRPGRFTFVIDPIDGTTNFAVGFTSFAVSIACFDKDQLIASSVCMPMEDSLYFAQKGKGGYKVQGQNPIRLKIKDKGLEHCILGTYITHDVEVRQQLFKFLNAINNKIRAIRVIASSVVDLCYLTDNRNGIVLYRGPKIWDISGMTLLIEEAGGAVRDWNGKELSYDLNDRSKEYSLLACHPKHVKKIVELLNK